MSTNTEMAVLDTTSGSEVTTALDGMNMQHGKGRGSDYFTTLVGNDRATKLATLDAMTNSTPAVDSAGKTIQVADVIVHAIEMADEKTGEMQPVARIILIDDKGKAHHAISGGLLKSLRNIFMIMGPKEEWEGNLPLIIEKEKGGKGTYYTAKVDLKAV